MKFVHPNILYLLFLLLIPIIIHLFNFRRYKKIYFSSLQFIKQVEKETKSTKTLRHYLLLTCRLLAFAAVILAFAQPYFPAKENANSTKNSVAIYLDNSYSMSAKGTNGNLLNQAKTTIRHVVSSYPLNQSFVFVTNELSGVQFRLISGKELKDRLQYVHLSPITRKLTTSLESIYEFLEQQHTQASHYYVVSDFQERNIQTAQVRLDTSAYYSLLKVSPQIQQNLYIDSVWFSNPFHRKGINNTLNIRIQNTGKKKLTNVEIGLFINGKKRQTLADIHANNSTVVQMNYIDQTNGLKTGKVTLQDRNLHFDNQYYFSYTVKKGVNILLIKGIESFPYPEYVYQTDKFYEVHKINIEQLKMRALEKTDLIVLNGLKKISSGLLTQLQKVHRDGANIVVIPAVHFDKMSYNRLLSNFHLPLLQETIHQSIRVGKIEAKYPFFRGLFSKDIDNVRMPPLKNYFTSRSYNRSNFRTLIQYENGMPLFVQDAKTSSIYMLYTPIAPSFNNFGKSALFSSLLLRIGENSLGKSPLSLTIGSSESYPIKSKNTQDEIIQLKQGELSFIPERNSTGNTSEISVRKAIDNIQIKDGIYKIMDNQKKIGAIALNFNRAESDMKYASSDDLQNFSQKLSLNNTTFKGINNQNDIQKLTLNHPDEFWRILLTLCLVFLLIEMAILIFWKVK